MIEFVSQSILGQHTRCPEQFRRRWMEGEIIPPGIAARRGSGAHKAAEINHIQKVISGEDLPVGDLQDAARDEYVRLVRDQGIFIPKEDLPAKNRLLAEGLDTTVRLAKLYHDELAPKIQPAPGWVERRVYMDVGLVVPLAGTLDVATVDGHLPDIKTAAKATPQSVADTSLQLSLYSALYAHESGKWPDQISLEVLVDAKVPKLVSLLTTRGPKDFAQLMLRIKLMLAQIETGLFPPCDPSAWICSEKFCGFALSCKYFIRR